MRGTVCLKPLGFIGTQTISNLKGPLGAFFHLGGVFNDHPTFYRRGFGAQRCSWTHSKCRDPRALTVGALDQLL